MLRPSTRAGTRRPIVRTTSFRVFDAKDRVRSRSTRRRAEVFSSRRDVVVYVIIIVVVVVVTESRDRSCSGKISDFTRALYTRADHQAEKETDKEKNTVQHSISRRATVADRT